MALTLVEDKTTKGLSLVEDKTQPATLGPQVPEATQDSLFKSLEDILYKRGVEQEQIQARELAPAVGGPKDVYAYALQTLGKTGAGTLSDIVGEVTGRAISAVTPESVKQGIKSAFETQAGQSLLSGVGFTVDQYREFAKENPSAAASIEAAANLALAAPGGAGKAAFKEQVGKLLSKSVSPLETAATQENIVRAREIVRPDRELLSEREREFRIGETKPKGPLRTLTIELNKEEDRAAELLGEVYNKDRTFTENYNEGTTFIRDQSRILQEDLNKYSDIEINTNDVTSSIASDMGDLFKETPTLTGAKALRSNVLKNYKLILNKYSKNGKISPGDLYQVRKEFDDWWDTEVSGINFEKTGGNRSQAELLIQSVRHSLNSKIDSVVPDEKFADRLYDLHSMIRGNKNVQLKAVAEDSNAIQRTMSNLGVGTREPLSRRVGRYGAAGAAVAIPSMASGYFAGIQGALAAGAAAATLGSVYGAYRAFKSPKVKRNISGFVKAMDRDVTNAVWFSNRAAFVENINNLYNTLEEESPLKQEEEQPK